MSSTVAPARATGPRLEFGALLRAEWTKLRSVRSTRWSLFAMIAISAGLAALATGVYTGQWDTMSAADRQQMIHDPIGLILQPAASYGQVAICVLGVMVVASEYSTGMIRTSLLAVPTRTSLLAAKVAVFGSLVFLAAEAVAVPSFLLGQRMLSRHVQVSWTDPGVVRALVGFGLYMAVTGLFALGIGAVLRHVAGAITAALAAVIVLPTVTSLLPGKLGDYVSTYLPGGEAGQSIMSSGHNSGVLLSPWAGFGVQCAWVLGLLVVTTVLLHRRDAAGASGG